MTQQCHYTRKASWSRSKTSGLRLQTSIEYPPGWRRAPAITGPMSAASSSEPPTSVGLACRPVGAWRRHLVKRTRSTRRYRHAVGTNEQFGGAGMQRFQSLTGSIPVPRTTVCAGDGPFLKRRRDGVHSTSTTGHSGVCRSASRGDTRKFAEDDLRARSSGEDPVRLGAQVN